MANAELEGNMRVVRYLVFPGRSVATTQVETIPVLVSDGASAREVEYQFLVPSQEIFTNGFEPQADLRLSGSRR